MAGRSKIIAPIPKVALGFRPEFLDFRRGIHVGNLEDHERITRILKLELEARYGQPFVTERWGRGVYWQWIGYLPRSNREAKPLSSRVSFGCAKFFISVDTDDQLFKSGLQVERGYLKAPRDFPECRLQSDWDWNRLMAALKPKGALERELRRLIAREGFRLRAGSWEQQPVVFSKTNFPAMRTLRKALSHAPGNHWVGFQLYYSMTESETRGTTGLDLVESMLAVFGEVTPIMNQCMQVKLAGPDLGAEP